MCPKTVHKHLRSPGYKPPKHTSIGKATDTMYPHLQPSRLYYYYQLMPCISYVYLCLLFYAQQAEYEYSINLLLDYTVMLHCTVL